MMNPFFYYFFPGWAFSLLLVTAFPITSDLFPENDNLFFPEQTESSMMLDGINMSGNTPDTHLFLADSSACLSPSDPQLLRRGLVATRESPGDSCITLDEPKTQSGSRTKNIPDLDLTRLMVIADVKDYWCSATADWGFGNVPVCSVGNSRTYASEEQLADMEILKMQQPTGFKSFVDCSLSM